jgi:transcription termination factor Rho
MNIEELEKKSVEELLELAKEKGISKKDGLRKPDLILDLLRVDMEKEGHTFCNGILDIVSNTPLWSA